MVGIYKITSPSNKINIGQSWDIKQREYNYSGLNCKNQTKLYNSLFKHGWNKHKFEIIHELPEDTTQEILDNYEIFYWQQYKDCGFEMLNIREPGRGGKHSEETILRMSKPRSEQAKQNMRIPKPGAGGKGKQKPEGFGKNLSIKLKGRKKSKESCLKRSIILKGRKISDITKEKMSIAAKGKVKSNKTKQLMSKVRTGISIKGKDILQFDLNNNFIKEWPSIKEAVQSLKIKSAASISNNLTKITNTAGGYIWKYKNKN